jgi:RHS repeat-associated protein
LYGSSRIGELRPDESDQNTYRKAISRDGQLYTKEVEPVKEELKEAEAVEEKTMGLSIFNEWDYKRDPEDLEAPELVDDPKKSQIIIGLTEADIAKIKEQLATKEVQLDEVRRQQLEQDLARGYTLAQAQAAPKPTLEQYFGPSYHTKWRYRGNRHYELDNHLGNVQVVITDKKIAHGSDNWEYYTADILSVHDYYAFGQDIDERNFERGTYRYGFNGKEKNDDISSNDYDFGARIYDGRLGRWLGVDPLASKYPDASPFIFALNTPIRAKDPDGKLVIFINGLWGWPNGVVNCGREYWGDDWLKNAQKAIGDSKPAKFYDGSVGGTSNILLNNSMQYRINEGEKQGYSDAANIIAGMDKDETIKIVTNSMGAAYERGFTKGFMRYANERLKEIAKEEKSLYNAVNGGKDWIGTTTIISPEVNSKMKSLSDEKYKLKNLRFEMLIDLSSHQVDFTDPNVERRYYMTAGIGNMNIGEATFVDEKSVNFSEHIGGTKGMNHHHPYDTDPSIFPSAEKRKTETESKPDTKPKSKPKN